MLAISTANNWGKIFPPWVKYHLGALSPLCYSAMRSSLSGFTRRAVVNLCPIISQIWTQLHPLLPICAPCCSKPSGISLLNFKTLSKKKKLGYWTFCLHWGMFVGKRILVSSVPLVFLLFLTRRDVVCKTPSLLQASVCSFQKCKHFYCSKFVLY